MKLIIFSDHRFHLDDEGIPRSRTHCNAANLQRRYLGAFDEVKIVARLAGGSDGNFRMGEKVELVSLGDWNGCTPLLLRWHQVSAIIKKHLDEAAAIMLVAPGIVGNMAIRRLIRRQQPFGVEIVGNPAEAMAAGSLQHPMRSLICNYFCKQLSQVCRHATSAIYVTNHQLQSVYPPGPDTFELGCSDIELQRDAFVNAPRVVSPKSEWRLVHVGSMVQPYKAHEVLIDALARCRSEGVRVTLALLGGGALRPRLEEEVQQLNLGEHVKFLGHLPPGEKVREQLDNADLFVLPSRTEGLPRATLEAMARALPCISTSVGGNPELLDGTELVPPGDARALADKIKQVLSDPDRMTRLSERNLRRAQEYRYELLLERRLQAYRHLSERTENWFRLNGFGTPGLAVRRAA